MCFRSAASLTVEGVFSLWLITWRKRRMLTFIQQGKLAHGEKKSTLHDKNIQHWHIKSYLFGSNHTLSPQLAWDSSLEEPVSFVFGNSLEYFLGSVGGNSLLSHDTMDKMFMNWPKQHKIWMLLFSHLFQIHNDMIIFSIDPLHKCHIPCRRSSELCGRSAG